MKGEISWFKERIMIRGRIGERRLIDFIRKDSLSQALGKVDQS
jgi:hypothetical protein